MKSLAFVFLTLGLAASGAAAGSTATVRGLAYAGCDDRRPLPRTLVTITARGGSRSVWTDRNGRYVLTGLQPGVYQIAAIRHGAAAIRRVLIDAGDTATVDVGLDVRGDGMTQCTPVAADANPDTQDRYILH